MGMVWPEVLPYLLVQVAAFAPTLLAVRRLWPNHRDPVSMADTLVSLVVFPILAGSAILASAKLCRDVEHRWSAVIPESNFFFLLYVSRSVFHIVLQGFERIPASHLALMTLHHLLSIACCAIGLLSSRMHFFACLAGACETSTVFLNNVYLSKELTVGGRELKELLPPWLYALNGFCLWLSFLVMRICLFPAWLYIWHRDITTAPELTWDKSMPVERYLFPFVVVFLLGLSTYWLAPITKGMLKALGVIAPKKE